MHTVQSAFPDFRNRIDALVAETQTAAARLTYKGTHRGRLFDVEPTGRKVGYAGAAFFRFQDGRIVDGWVLGDIDGLRRQLGA